MNNDKYKKAIKILPLLFNSQLLPDSSGNKIFDILSKIFEFDEAYIYFVNNECVQLKYSSEINPYAPVESIFPLKDNLKKILFDSKGLILSQSSPFFELLKLKKYKSSIISKLTIRGTVYGFVLLCKKEEKFFNNDDLNVLDTVASAVSYIIKDIELSNVFKIQLKALKDNIQETNAASKIIKEQNLKILESDKIKNEFLANISHELRTPLNAIIGFSEVLSEGIFGELNAKQADYIKDIHVSGIHLLGMINEILDISKIEANAMTINRTSFDLSRAVNEVVNIIKPLANRKNIQIKKTLSMDGEILADFQKISQILYNLLSNAIKFTEKDGEIEISTKFNDNSFIISVSDNGVGIDEKYFGKIFAKFVQLESSYTKKESSTGLGLTITKELVEMHGGKISVKSEVGKGTTFIVEIPLLKR